MGSRLPPASPVPLPRGLVTAAKKAGAGSLGLRPEVPERAPLAPARLRDRTLSSWAHQVQRQQRPAVSYAVLGKLSNVSGPASLL